MKISSHCRPTLIRKGALFVACALSASRLAAVEIQFDYSLDSTGFFAAGTQARTVLEAAGADYAPLLQDSLGALTPVAPNALSIDFRHPTSQALVGIGGPNIPANTLVVYVGASNLPGTRVGSASIGGTYASGGVSWLDFVDTRGQTGIVYGFGANEVAPWGGSITVDTHDLAGAPRQWNYSLTAQSTPMAELHLYSIVLHELGHVLGFGACDAWDVRINAARRFVGTNASASYGGPVPVDPFYSHWEEGTTSTRYGTTQVVETAMDPALDAGTVSYVTSLDLAGLKDLGWNVAAPAPVPVAPDVSISISPDQSQMTLSWTGVSAFQYTVISCGDLEAWTPVSSPLPGVNGPMTVHLPVLATPVFYRVRVEANTSGEGLEEAAPIALLAPPQNDGGTLGSRVRGGHSADRHSPASGDHAAPLRDWCGGCDRASHSHRILWNEFLRGRP